MRMKYVYHLLKENYDALKKLKIERFLSGFYPAKTITQNQLGRFLTAAIYTGIGEGNYEKL